jgi:mono/diheme cytochrome c family protein
MPLPRTLALLLLVLLPGTTHGIQNRVDVEDLRPGLVATYTDSTSSRVTQLDPIPALALKQDEAPHPRLRADGGKAEWQGYINILRAGEYRFGATLRGGVRLRIGDRLVLDAKAGEATAARKEGAAVRLQAGVWPIRIEYTRPAGRARLEILWKAPHISEEPLARDALFHVPADKSPLTRALQVERGRFLVEERNCTGCHRPAAGDRLAVDIYKRQGPDLSAVGRRVWPGWMYHYLLSPQELSPGSDMPHFFDKEDGVECYAVTRFLESLGGPVREVERPPVRGQVEVGKRLFQSVGCSVCHTEGTAEIAARYPLPDLHAKTSLPALVEFLANPLGPRPGGRMPNMLLNKKEATALARYLRETRPEGKKYDLPQEPSVAEREKALRKHFTARDIEALPGEGQWVELGRRIVAVRNCVACHTISPGGRAVQGTLAKTSFEDIKGAKQLNRGCLVPESGERGKAPWFALTRAQREDIAAFLREGTTGAGSAAPAYHARVTLQRFNCLACHDRDGEGGLAPAQIEELRKYEKAENAEALAPPSLSGVGHKLLTPWFRKVLTESGRARPWMALRMPQFGAANVGHLPEGIAAIEGTTPQDAMDRAIAPTAEKIETGRQLIGKGSFGCTSCHDIAGVVTGGTRGPDLPTTNQRVRYPWFRRWLESAQRMHPGTKMPTIFPEGKSLLEKVLGGNPDAQSEAMWAYLAIGPTLPLPDGIEMTSKGTILAASKRPVLLRTFMPDAGTRAVAVGYPGGIATVFDSTQCRLAYAWAGAFLDAGPVWNNRGGAPANVLGTRFWTAPPGFPWSVSKDGPGFEEQSKDPAFGAPLPEGQVYQGPAKLFCDGYQLDKGGLPTYLYRVAAGKESVKISERPEPVRGPLANGLSRHFTLEIPAQQPLWFYAGDCVQMPRFLGSTGKIKHLPGLTKESWGICMETTSDWVVVLSQGDGRVMLVQISGEVQGLHWHARQEKNGPWKMFLRVPAGPDAQSRRVEVRVLVPHGNDPNALQQLLSRKE